MPTPDSTPSGRKRPAKKATAPKVVAPEPAVEDSDAPVTEPVPETTPDEVPPRVLENVDLVSIEAVDDSLVPGSDIKRGEDVVEPVAEVQTTKTIGGVTVVTPVPPVDPTETVADPVADAQQAMAATAPAGEPIVSASETITTVIPGPVADPADRLAPPSTTAAPTTAVLDKPADVIPRAENTAPNAVPVIKADVHTLTADGKPVRTRADLESLFSPVNPGDGHCTVLANVNEVSRMGRHYIERSAFGRGVRIAQPAARMWIEQQRARLGLPA